MVNCSVIGCKSRTERKTDNITFHSFPKDQKLKEDWTNSTGRKNWVPGKNARLCSKHFNPNCIRKTLHYRYLKAGSVPTLHVHRFQSRGGCGTAPEVSTTRATLPYKDTLQLETDLENYMRYKYSGGKVSLKKDVVPHKFQRKESKPDKPECTADLKKRKSKLNSTSASYNIEEIYVEDTGIIVVNEEIVEDSSSSVFQSDDCSDVTVSAHEEEHLMSIKEEEIFSDNEEMVEKLSVCEDVLEESTDDRDDVRNCHEEVSQAAIEHEEEIFVDHEIKEEYHTDDFDEFVISYHEGETHQHQTSIQACRGCLSIDALTPVDPSLSHAFTQATGVLWNDERLPDVLCVQCKALVAKFHKFRERARRVNDVLMQLSSRNDLDLTNINKIKRKKICVKPLLESRHYPANHCDLHHDDDDGRNVVKDFKMEESEPTQEKKQVNASEKPSSQEMSWEELLISPKREEIDSIYLTELDTSVIDVKVTDLLDNANLADDTPDFTNSSTSLNISQNNSTSILARTPAVKHKSTSKLDVFICDRCSLEFKSQGTLIRHIKLCYRPTDDCSIFVNETRKTGEKQIKKIECKYCGDTFLSKSELIIHKTTHTGQKPYVCKVCDSKYTERGGLKRHLITHTGDKRFMCDICGLKCYQLQQLKIHMRVHTGEKPYACKHCDFKSSQRNNLMTHLRTHTGEKPCMCSVCGKCFSQPTHLLLHMRTHTGERPYACNDCDYKSAYRSNIIVHVKTHHLEVKKKS